MAFKDTGGPAFPVHEQISALYDGMTLRDYFAGQALVGLLSDGRTQGIVSRLAREDSKDATTFMAEAAYQFADAMLEARK